jgi:transcriptional regulator with XRE-family HTH domain
MRLTPIQEFQGRLRHLLSTRFDGQYTQLARRAGVPITTMQHYMHNAKHLPGGEHAIRLANTLGVTVDYLLAGVDSIRPHELLSNPIILVQVRGKESIELDRHIAIPVFTCLCPKECPFAEEIPPVSQTHDRVVVPEDLVSNRHRLIGLRLTRPMPELKWREGTRLVIDWDARKANWQAMFLVREGGRCRLVRLHRLDGQLLLGTPNGTTAPPHPAGEDVDILGRVVATVSSL